MCSKSYRNPSWSYVPEQHDDVDAVKLALEWILKNASPDGECLVVAPFRNRDIQRGALLEALEPESARLVKKGCPFTLSSSDGSKHVTVKVVLPKDAYGAGGVIHIVVLWPEERVLKKLDDGFLEGSNILAVASRKGQGDEWRTRWGFRPLRDSSVSDTNTDEIPLGYEKLKAAIEDCAVLVNEKTGLCHPSDRDTFVEGLLSLHRAGVRLDPEFIERTLRNRGWSIEYAMQVGDLARGINDGRKPRVSHQP